MQIDHNIIPLMSPSSVQSRKTPLWRKRRRKCMYFCNGEEEFRFLHICLCLRLPFPRLPSIYRSLSLAHCLLSIFSLFSPKKKIPFAAAGARECCNSHSHAYHRRRRPPVPHIAFHVAAVADRPSCYLLQMRNRPYNITAYCNHHLHCLGGGCVTKYVVRKGR